MKAGDRALVPTNCGYVGARVWSRKPIKTPGGEDLLVPASTGGVLILRDIDGLSIVRWDNGAHTMHPYGELLKRFTLIGNCLTLDEYIKTLWAPELSA